MATRCEWTADAEFLTANEKTSVDLCFLRSDFCVSQAGLAPEENFGGKYPNHTFTAFTTFDVRRVFDNIVRLAEPEVKLLGLGFRAHLDTTLFVITSDEPRVLLIARNLIGNALKYTPAGEVYLDFAGLDENRWCIRVRDTGPGIPEEEHENIFKEFHRLAPHTGPGGAGLGLAIVKNAVDCLGGQIGMRSVPGSGSEFTVTLPRSSHVVT